MAGFDFKNEIRQSVKRKRGLLKEVAVKLDPRDPTKVIIGRQPWEVFDRSGIVDRGIEGAPFSDDADDLLGAMTRIRKRLRKLRDRYGGFTAAGQKQSKRVDRQIAELEE